MYVYIYMYVSDLLIEMVSAEWRVWPERIRMVSVLYKQLPTKLKLVPLKNTVRFILYYAGIKCDPLIFKNVTFLFVQMKKGWSIL